MTQPAADWTPVVMPDGPKRNRLVIVRTGKSSLHPTWRCDLGGKDRSWDLLLSHFDDKCDPVLEDADIVVRQGAFKFGACYKLFQDIPWLSSYRSVWFCDDDIATDWAVIERMFDIFEAYDLDLAQPALTQDSFWSHAITLEQPDNLLRFTNFVEVMVPLFSGKAIQKCCASFEGAVTGWGLDFAWPHLVGNAGSKVAVIDATPVRHTRQAATGPIYDQARSANVSPHDECENNLARYGLTRGPNLEYGSIRKDPMIVEQIKRDTTGLVHDLLFKSLALVPASWTGEGGEWRPALPWQRDLPQMMSVPPFLPTDMAMSFGMTISLEPSAQMAGDIVLCLGTEHPKVRLIAVIAPVNAQAYRLALHLFDCDGKSFALMSPEMLFGRPTQLVIQFVPAIGWMQCLLDGEKAGDVSVPPFSWRGFDKVRIGSDKTKGTIEGFWAKPCLLGEGL